MCYCDEAFPYYIFYASIAHWALVNNDDFNSGEIRKVLDEVLEKEKAMTAQEAYKKMIEYSSQDKCCWFVDRCINGIDACSKNRGQCQYYQAFSKVKKALEILQALEEK